MNWNEPRPYLLLLAFGFLIASIHGEKKIAPHPNIIKPASKPAHKIYRGKKPGGNLQPIQIVRPDLDRVFVYPYRFSGKRILFGVAGTASPRQKLFLYAGCKRCRTTVHTDRRGHWTALVPMQLDWSYSDHILRIGYSGRGTSLSVNVQWGPPRTKKKGPKKEQSRGKHKSQNSNSKQPKPVPPAPKPTINPASARATLGSLFQAALDGDVTRYCSLLQTDQAECQTKYQSGIPLQSQASSLLAALPSASWSQEGSGFRFTISGSSWLVVPSGTSWVVVA